MFGAIKRRIVWFPFLLIAMTVVLAITIVVIDHNRTSELTAVSDVLQVQNNVSSAVTDTEYQQNVKMVLEPVWSVLANGAGESAAIVSVRDQLVAMRVSSESRDLHIQLVAACNQLVRGLLGDPDVLADAQIRFQGLTTNFVWLK
ncbi:hypothetical protein COV06_03955 [Candidatus Uhrbacteria bacterium CG10_big_fil_rev_8_21_14_0_10_50_16]|uniref:Uncharacterized protein n=1 Tax=Candidatus Uhrbacteria bacterium CG10_big_fil_rev_8_21_14_0_10_50_16 TaxID=1975039 RepID=A0A2H0RLD3_9BACT|nr:MAG: hypothetical protein COV06_03955 [Candidatus Uhrbacteria bacterium CG10_big_fil_rev_8_21_14_0_10_50_16]